MKLSKGIITLLVIAGIALVAFMWVKNSYNKMVLQEEQVTTAWAQVENVYQRRADLIPNLVATVKGYASHESETLEAVVNARAKATQTTIDPTNMTAETMARFQSAQGELSQALSRLMVVVEQYPDLKANQNFLELQAQLEGTENRITVERQKFNETARLYNTTIRQFPKNIFAGMFGFERKTYFEANEGAQNAPVVEF
jgi:LemA protein